MAEKMRKLTFWENFYRPMKRIGDRAKRAEYALKVLEYAFDGTWPELDDMEAMAFESIAPLIDEDMHGNKGGRPKSPTPTRKKTPTKTPSETGSETSFETGYETTEETSLYEEKGRERKGKEEEGSSSLKKKNHSSVASDGAAAAGAAPSAAPHCPLCGVKVFRNTQLGRYECPNCHDTFDNDQVGWK